MYIPNTQSLPVRPSPPHGRWWLRCHILCSVLRTGILIAAILTEADAMILLNKPCSLQNRIIKIEFTQTVPITNTLVVENHNDFTSHISETYFLKSKVYHTYMYPKILYNLMTCYTSPHDWSSACNDFFILQ